MNAKNAKDLIKEFIDSPEFQRFWGGGLIEEALHRGITALEKEDSPKRPIMPRRHAERP